MRKNFFSIFEKAKSVFPVIAFSVFFLILAGTVSAYTVSGYVRQGTTPVTDATVHLMNGNSDVGSCHTSSTGFFSISTTCASECNIIAVPDNIDAVYVPTYYPNVLDGYRGYVIYPADMPENAVIEPVSSGEAAIAGGTQVTVTGNINTVNISGVPAFVYVMNNGTLCSYHPVNVDGSFSFTAMVNSSTTLMITNAGYKTLYFNYTSPTIATRGNSLDWNINISMEAISGNGSVVTPSSNNVRLEQNFPNPFNPTTNIAFNVSTAGLVKVTVYDLSGRMVSQLVNEFRNPGPYSVTFNAANLSSGIYYYSIQSNNTRITKQMMLIK